MKCRGGGMNSWVREGAVLRLNVTQRWLEDGNLYKYLKWMNEWMSKKKKCRENTETQNKMARGKHVLVVGAEKDVKDWNSIQPLMKEHGHNKIMKEYWTVK